MSLIPKDELHELKLASAVKTVADGAIEDQYEMEAAYLINTAANTGAHTVVWSKEMPDTLKDALEANGYQVLSDNRAADPNKRWIIGGF
jgi:hypothetical protein